MNNKNESFSSLNFYPIERERERVGREKERTSDVFVKYFTVRKVFTKPVAEKI